MRLFIAIDFEELRGYFTELQDQLPKEDIKLTLAKSFHQTLKFLGEIPETKIKEINEKLEKIKIEPFPINLDDIGVFPNEKFIRVVWVGISPKDKVVELQKNIENSLKEFDFKKDFDFHPHITLARVKFIKDKGNFIDSLKKIKIDKGKKIEFKNFKLIQSLLTPKGPVYEDLKVFG